MLISLSRLEKPLLHFPGCISFSANEKIQLVTPLGPSVHNILKPSASMCAGVPSLLSEYQF